MPASPAKIRDLPQSAAAGQAAPAQTGELRPQLLNPLFAALTTLPGVGPAVAATAARLLGRPDPRCLELLAHLPIAAIDPTPRAALSRADQGEMVTLRAVIERHRPGRDRQPRTAPAAAPTPRASRWSSCSSAPAATT